MREVRPNEGEAASQRLPGWLVIKCTCPAAQSVMSPLCCELMNGILPVLLWWVTSWGHFKHLASGRWAVGVVAQWILSLTLVQQQKTVTQHLPTSPAVEVSWWEHCKSLMTISPVGLRRDTQQQLRWDFKREMMTRYEICILGLFQRLSSSLMQSLVRLH